MSLIDTIDEQSGIVSEGDADIVDAIKAADGTNGEAQSDAPTEDHTQSDKAPDASSDRAPEGDGKEEGDSLVDDLETSPANKKPDTDEVDDKDKATDEKEDSNEDSESDDSGPLSDEDKAKLEADLLGSSELESATDPVWKQRYDDQTQYTRELEQDKSDKEAELATLFKTLGRKIITTKDGLQLSNSDDAKDFLAEDVNVDDIVKSLTQKELALLGPDEEINDPQAAAKLLAGKVAEVFASQVPPITAKAEDEILSQRQRDDVYYDFINEKLSDGSTTRFPDCEKPEIKSKLSTVLTSKDPRMSALRKAALKDPEVQSAYLELAWLRVNRATQTVMTLASADKKTQADKKETNKLKPSVGGTGGGNKGTSTEAPQDKSGKILSFLDDVHKGGSMLAPEL